MAGEQGVWTQTSQSTSVISLDDFRADPRFSGVDGQGYSVVVIDTGIDLNHTYFGSDADSNGISDRIVYSYDFSGANDSDASDFDDHGSNVASIIGSSNGTHRGMAPGVNIIALKVFTDGGSGNVGDIDEALDWVVANTNAYNIVSVNMSIGVTTNVNSYAAAGTNAGLADEYALLAAAGVTVTVSSGNSFYEFSSAQGVDTLGASPDVLTIGAVYDANTGGWGYGGAQAFSSGADRLTPFSQRSTALTSVFAPGAVITGASASGGTVDMHGTSQAAPHVAGIVALMQDLAVERLGRRLTFPEVKSIIQATADSITDGDDEDDNVTNTGANFGRINVMAIGNAIWAMGSDTEDLDDQISEAIPVTFGNYTGTIDASGLDDLGDVDMYSITVTAGMTVTFDIDLPGSFLDSNLRLFDATGFEINWNHTAVGFGTEYSSTESYISHTFGTAGTYYLGVSGWPNDFLYNPVDGTDDDSSSEGSYTLEIRTSDQDDQISEATEIGFGSYNGEITSDGIDELGDVDMYAITVTAGMTVSFDIDTPAAILDSRLRLWDASGGLLADSDDDAGPAPEYSGVEAYFTYTFTTAGTYYISVFGFGNSIFNPLDGTGDAATGSEGTYTLDVRTYDLDDQIPEAIHVGFGSFTGEISTDGILDLGDVDMYGITVSAGMTVLFDIDLPGSSLDSNLRLFDAWGLELAYNHTAVGFGTEYSATESYISYTFGTAGTYYLGVSGWPNDYLYDPNTGNGDSASSEGTYALEIRTRDLDDQISEATPIFLGAAYTREVSLTGLTDVADVDMYSFTVSAGWTVLFDIDIPDSGLDSWIQLFDASGNLLAYSDDDYGPGDEYSGLESYLSYRFVTGGTFYIAVSGYSNSDYDPLTGDGDESASTGSYLLTTTRLNTPPDITSSPTASVNENLAASTVVYTATATDSESAVTWSLSGVDASLLSIDSATGQVRLNALANYELKSTYQFTVTATDDGDLTDTLGVTLTIQDVNEAPVIANFSDVLTYFPGTTVAPGAVVYIDQNATLTDPDSSSYNGGELRLEFIAGADSANNLGIRLAGTGAGQFNMVGTTLRYATTAIGTVSGGVGTAPLVVSFNANASKSTVNLLIRNLTFSNPTALNTARTLRLSVRDGAVGVGQTAISQKQLNVAPAAGSFNETLHYTPGTTAYVDQTVTLVGGNFANYNGGELRVDFSAGAESNNRLGVRLTGTGYRQFSMTGSNLLYQNVVIGTLTGGVGTAPLSVLFNSNATPSIVRELLNNLTFSNASPAATPRTMRLTLRDAAVGTGTTSAPVYKTVNVVPVVGSFNDVLNYQPGTLVYLDQNVTVSDSDTASYNGGRLTVDFASGVDANNVIGIRLAGSGAGQFNLSGATLRYGTTVIGTVAGGTGTTPLTVDFNTSASPGVVQALLRNLTFQNSAPAAGAHIVRVVIRDGAAGVGGTSSVALKSINMLPVIGAFNDPLHYQKGALVYIDQNATLTDGDTAHYNGGRLTVDFSTGAEATNVLGVRLAGTGSGQFNLVGSSLRYGTTTIGTLAGGTGTTPLTVDFNSGASPAVVQQLIRNLTYQNSNLSSVTHTIRVTLRDGAVGVGGTVAAAKLINLVPTLSGFDGSVSYVRGTTIYLDTSVSVTDPEQDFVGGRLELAWVSGADANNRLSIRNQGTGAGLLGLNGSNVTYGGVTFGTLSGGVGGQTLVIQFNQLGNLAANVRATAVNVLARYLTFSNVAASPSNLNRVVSLSIFDGQGGVSNTQTKSITLK